MQNTPSTAFQYIFGKGIWVCQKIFTILIKRHKQTTSRVPAKPLRLCHLECYVRAVVVGLLEGGDERQYRLLQIRGGVGGLWEHEVGPKGGSRRGEERQCEPQEDTDSDRTDKRHLRETLRCYI